MKNREVKPVIKAGEGEELIPTEILQRHIVAVSENFKKAMSVGLKQETIAILIQAKTKIPKTTIHEILYWMPRLAEEFTTK